MRSVLLFLLAGCGDVLVGTSSPISTGSIQIETPAEGSVHVQGLLTVTGTVSTGTTVEVRAAGRIYTATTSGARWSQTIDTSTVPLGALTIVARSDTSSDAVTIALVAPPFTIAATVAIGARGIEVRASSTHAGRIFYAVHAFDAGSLNASAIRDLALNGGSLASGVINATPNRTHRARVAGLGEELPYWIHVAAESDTHGLLPDDRIARERIHTRPRQPALTLTASTSTVNYWAYFPDDYYFEETRSFPTLIFFHGVGEMDDGTPHAIFKVLIHGPPMMVRRGDDFDMIVLAPQATATAGYQIGWMDAFVEGAMMLHRIDPDALYATGLSLGGNATWLYTQAHPEKIAAAIPIGAWLDDLTAACEMSDVPIWAFHGEADDLIVPARARAPIDAINTCLPPPPVPAQITIYPGGGHNVWTQTYENASTPENIYDWLLRQRK